MRIVASILWRRLDLEGHDACLLSESGRLSQSDGGHSLKGQALFVQDGKPCNLAYEVTCDAGWRARSARVDGFLGTQDLHYAIERRADDGWTLNGERQGDVAGLIDIDLGFTPATNLLAIRRFDLEVGMATPAPAAYLTFPELRLVRLEQTYRRLDGTRYAYAAPMFGYDEILEVSPAGFVVDYPGLWRGAARLG
ncbi:putative glycolipid-binding domain-containing protein [Mesorhizobium sp.]|uniref:putative glycolipid-binding domain-containing protein n=1 Tax=Mesorhizobium sp. TaxID=1871066 RepID=UPI0012019C51|nr:putative glycolipid-binding domain-containing protein [Mesorhizobium sp.]TIO06262.1 MAG: hypothetical protein E5X88_23045 [Mesorhizobium sp.]TIO29212.1 MAG: hypothetical protein E5X89_31750 [Mesorhizobium sp.]TIP10005.1 MAG: hypothetical protein E5X73_25020 [Mesorhizobium sp.]